MGYEFLDKTSSYYLDPDTAMWFNNFLRWNDEYAPRNEFGESKRASLTHRRSSALSRWRASGDHFSSPVRGASSLGFG